MPSSKKIPLAGTEHVTLPKARAIGPTEPHLLLEISVVLKHRQPLPDHVSGIREHISHSEFARTYGADPNDIEKVRQFARKYRLQMLERGDEVLRRTVTLAGTAANMEKAFGVELTDYEHPEGTYRSHAGAVQIPEELAPVVSGVLGLDDRPIAHPHLRHHTQKGSFGARLASLSYNPQQVGALYGFPTGVDVSQQTIAILELGGGYRPGDIKDYFDQLGLPVPRVKRILVDHGHNRPTTANSADGEVMLDIEVAAAVAPGVNIVVYFAPNTAQGFLDALSTAVHDQLNKPCVISISWGGPESGWSHQSLDNFDQVAKEAALLGVTITVASGDNGSSDGVNDGKDHVDFPASSPHVLACGGTRLVGQNGSITDETVWNDGAQGGATGGGFSTYFARPEWQTGVVAQAQRGVPDVAGNADPETGYNVLVDGQSMVVGGTSAVAPLWAGLIALLNQNLNQRVGFINPLIYALSSGQGFRDITQGNNGTYSAGEGWDATTGKGTPVAAQLQAALMAAAANRGTSAQAPPAVPAD